MDKFEKQRISDYLSRYLECQEKIRNERDHLASLRSIVENCTTKLSLTAGRNPSRDKDRFENAMIDLTEEERKADSRIRAYSAGMAEVEDLISSVPDAGLQKILRLRYISGYPPKRISRELSVSRPQYYRLMNMALDLAARNKKSAAFSKQRQLETF